MYPTTSGTYTSWILSGFAATTSPITLKIEGFIDILSSATTGSFYGYTYASSTEVPLIDSGRFIDSYYYYPPQPPITNFLNFISLQKSFNAEKYDYLHLHVLPLRGGFRVRFILNRKSYFFHLNIFHFFLFSPLFEWHSPWMSLLASQLTLVGFVWDSLTTIKSTIEWLQAAQLSAGMSQKIWHAKSISSKPQTTTLISAAAFFRKSTCLQHPHLDSSSSLWLQIPTLLEELINMNLY